MSFAQKKGHTIASGSSLKQGLEAGDKTLLWLKLDESRSGIMIRSL